MELIETFGDHKIYRPSFTSEVVHHIKNLYGFELQNSHLNCEEYQRVKDKSKCNVVDMVDLHQAFYQDMKTHPEFLTKYKKMLTHLLREIFPHEHWMVIQTMPNIRFHMPDTICVPPHRDIDEGEFRTAHPEGEHNFLLTCTQMQDTNAMYIESSPQKADYKLLSMSENHLLHFNGNKCVHGNRINQTDKTRVSIDFRAITLENMSRYKNNGIVRTTQSRDYRDNIPLDMGGYYEIVRLKENINQMQPSFSMEEANAAKDYILSGGFLTEYRHTRELEARLAEFIGIKHCFMVSNGTLAISAALLAVGITKDSKVLVPTYTMVATANAVRLLGATPVFVDVSESTNTISPEIVRAHIEEVDAVIHVSLNNRVENLEEIVSICKQYKKPLVEDAAQSLGSTYKGQALGTFGDIATFSFSSPKIISMGQGGCIVTNNDELAVKIRRIKDFGRDEPGVEKYTTFGVNLKYTDLQSVVGLEQVKKLPVRVEAMSRIWMEYYDKLGDYMIAKTDNGWIPWFIEIFVDDRDILAQKLRNIGIGVREVYPPIHAQPAYAQAISLPVAERIRERGLWLPSWSALNTKMVEDICNCIKLSI